MNWNFSKSALHCGAACIALVCANAAWAQAKPIDIPAEDAGKSIPELARQAGVQIIAPGQALHGVVTPALKGDYEVRVALSGMLKGTDLTVASDDGQTIVLAQNQKNVSAAADEVAANTPNASVEQVVVTGSRVISSIANSPTPLTVVTTQELQSTTPSNIPDALNKLPVFVGSQQPRTAGNGGSGSGMNILNLRNFGAQRTLVLFDGHRVAPDTANGTVDIDTIPQMLMSRVDVVTGGASAVYGSDAVTGVVNFVLDKHFTGLKFDINSGISNYGDGFGYKLSAAAGADLFGGRGHFEMSLEHFSQDGVPIANRPYGPQVWTKAGAGSAASPYVNVENTRSSPFSNGGVITCSAPCTINGQQFIANGVVGPFINGLSTPTNLVQSGGDGAYDPYGVAITPFRTNTAFGRFSYNLTNDITFYAQATGAESYATGTWYPTQIHPGTSGAANTPNTFFTNNAFLSPTVQQELNPTNVPGQTFQLGEYINEFGFTGTPGTINVNRYLSGQTGLDGTLFGGRFDWDIYYSHGESRQTISNYRNPNNARFYAAEDAVPGPNGSVQCYVSTTQYANLYPGCVPLDPFGPTAISQSAYDYISSTTRYIMTNKLDDLSGSVSGTAFDDWAGPVKVALSAEMRWNSYNVNSNASPTATVDCTGLRLCSSAAPLWQQNTVASVNASDNVWEVALEGDIPLLKDLPYVQSFDMNLAGRYTDYSVSGSVQTWKIGLDYHVNDDIRFRGTTSIDIRAPTLNDLFSPKQNSVTGFFDIYTNTNGSPFISSQGNPNLVPEVARTYTGGLVYTPSYIPGLTVSYDYYHINLKNAIGSVSPSSDQVQHLCINSGGTSPYCSLFVRPLPFGNNTAANYPTQIISESLNTAYNAIEGSDIEVDYQFAPGDVIEGVPGSINLRNLVNYQPVNESQLFPSAALTWSVMSKGHVTSFIDYTIDSWTIGLENRWISNFKQASQPTIFYALPYIRSQDYIDINLAKDFNMDGGDFTAYFTVQNIFNSEAPLDPQTVGAPGIYYPVPNGASGGAGADVMGRYFTIGLRASL